MYATIFLFFFSMIKPLDSFSWQADHDMISALLNQKYKNGRTLSEREIAHILIALLMAGQHTSSTTGTWTLLHIADNPDIGCVHFFVEARLFTHQYVPFHQYIQ